MQRLTKMAPSKVYKHTCLREAKYIKLDPEYEKPNYLGSGLAISAGFDFIASQLMSDRPRLPSMAGVEIDTQAMRSIIVREVCERIQKHENESAAALHRSPVADRNVDALEDSTRPKTSSKLIRTRCREKR